MYIDFIRVLYHQLNECPEDFFTDIVTSENFLTVALGNLFANIEASSEKNVGELTIKAKQFRSYLMKKFKFDFHDPSDD
jgi:A1 cistron-splicing factor AAR2